MLLHTLLFMIVIVPNVAYASNMHLNAEDKAWINSHKTIKMGIDNSYGPYSFLDDEGNFKGMVKDYLVKIEKSLGIHFTIVSNLTWLELMKAIKAHQIDAIATVKRLPDREKFLSFSKPYITTPLVLVTRKETKQIATTKEMSKLKLALVKGYSSSLEFIKDYPDTHVLYVTSPLDGLQALASNRVDGYIGVIGTNTFVAARNGLNNLKVNTAVNMKTNKQSFGVRGDWPQLAQLLDKALDAIPIEEKDAISKKYLGIDLNKLKILDQYSYVVAFAPWVIGLITLLLLAYLLSIIWNLKLQKELKKRTLELEKDQAIAHFGDWRLDVKSGVLKWSDELFRIAERHPTEANTLDWETLRTWIYPEDVQIHEQILEQLSHFKPADSPIVFISHLLTPSGTSKYLEITNSVEFDENSEPSLYYGIARDITGQIKAEKKLQKSENKIGHMLYYDALTNLGNKLSLETFLSSSAPKTLFLFNINNFSYINTAYGFDVGDKLLQQVATLLQKNFQSATICRIHADEFALLFDGEIEIKKTILDIKECFYLQEIHIDTITLHVSFSFGIAYGNEHLFRNSALALKQAKERGKNNYYIYNQDESSINSEKRGSFIKANNMLYKAIQSDEIVPFFQGIRNNKTNEIVKFEVLVRIVNEDRIIAPCEFLESAKLSGLLPEITKIMIVKSFKIMQSNSYTFSINITEEDLTQHYLLDFLEEKCLYYKIKQERVTLEILEGISSGGKKNHLRQLTDLKAKGYRVAIDDFGTEYSNFERVLDLEIDYLKIDAKYIKNIDINKKSYDIVSAIMFFAKKAKVPCIAEFVHSEAVQKIVKVLEIDYSQGYYFSKPAPEPIARENTRQQMEEVTKRIKP